MDNTIDSLILIIKENNIGAFKSILGTSLKSMGKNEEMVNNDFKKLNVIFQRYHIEQPSMTFFNTPDDLGRKKYELLLFQGVDTVHNLKEVKLTIFMGPPTIVSLDKITNYELEFKHVKELEILTSPFKN